ASATCRFVIGQLPYAQYLISIIRSGAAATWQHPIGQPPVMWHPRQRRSMTGQPTVTGGQPPPEHW
ncbi:hypothetical protein Tco_0948222, partial [Tanacetum coccineum]